MATKEYFFTYEEVVMLREAMAEYKQFIQPQREEGVSEKRKRAVALAAAMYDQFKNDVRWFRE